VAVISTETDILLAKSQCGCCVMHLSNVCPGQIEVDAPLWVDMRKQRTGGHPHAVSSSTSLQMETQDDLALQNTC